MQGAGGVGGLLAVSCYGSATTNCFPAFDGNGNVAALINAADGTVAANYEYAAFGEPVRVTGVMARNNPFRFSTKYADDESDLLYYGYRYYKPSTGTWISRDPMQEYGGINIYSILSNDTVNHHDTLGLFGPLAGFAIDCIKQMAGALFSDWLKDSGDNISVCATLRDDIRSGTQIPCDGYDFPASPFLNNAEDKGVLGKIADCLIGKITDKGIGQLLKNLPDGVEKQLLEKAIGGGAESGQDALKNLTVDSVTKKIHAACSDKGINVTVFLDISVQFGGQTFTLSKVQKDLGTCMGTAKGTVTHDLGCSCCDSNK